MIPCIQLFSLSQYQPPEEAKEQVEISTEACMKLCELFKDCPRVIPIAVIGDDKCGKSFILDSFLRSPDGACPFAEFRDQTGLIAYPQVVSGVAHQYLLLELSGSFFQEEEDDRRKLTKQKMLHALLSVVSVVIVCFSRSLMFTNLAKVLSIYETMQKKSPLALSKFFICVENQRDLEREPLARGYRKFLQGPCVGLCDFFFRGNAGFREDELERMINLISSENFHKAFEDTHQRYQGQVETPSDSVSVIERLLSILITLGKLANYDFTWERHVAIAPDFTLELDAQLVKMEEMMRLSECLNTSEALHFFTRVENAVEIDSALLAKLKKNYKMTEPLVLVALFGSPGKGKSTLINCIIQQLLGVRVRKMIFEEGNSTIHTTIGSYVLSTPLKLPSSNSQLMFVDLEGLEGTETSDQSIDIIQRNLIYSILAITSVYCIFVGNEKNSIDFVEKQLKQIEELQATFRFTIERIFLLFHDRDLCCEPNQDWVNLMDSWNQMHFNRKEVIRILHKPNFKDPTKAQMFQDFLSLFLSDIDYPKKQQNGELMDMLGMISYMSLISKSREPDISKLGLTREQERTKKKVIQKKQAEIHAAFEDARYEDEAISLVQVFTRKTDAIIEKTKLIPELGRERSSLSLHVTAALNTSIESYRIQLIEVENFYKSIRGCTTEELKAKASESIDFLYRDNLIVLNFITKSSKLKKQYSDVGRHYPGLEEPDITEIVKYINNLQTKKEALYLAHLSVNILLIFGSVGLGSVVAAGIEAARLADLALTSARIVGQTAIALIPSFIWAAKAGTAGAFWISAPDKAHPLFDKNAQLNLPQQAGIETLDFPMGTVLLVIGKKKMKIDKFLNEFIRATFPMFLNYHGSFRDSGRIQAVMFPKFRYENEEPNRFGVVIYIRMKRNVTTEKAKRLAMLAATLMTKSSLTYFFYDFTKETDDYIKDILTAYQPRDLRRPRIITQYNQSISRELHQSFSNKRMELNPDQMEFLDTMDQLKVHCSTLSLNFFNSTAFTILDLRNVLTQGKVYLEESALTICEDQTKSKQLIQILTDLQPSKEMALVLILGRKDMGIPQFLNDFMKSTFPLQGDYKPAFNDNNRIQAHYFCQLGNQQTTQHGLLVYIQMENNPLNPRAEKLPTIAAMFLAKSTLALFFLDSTEEVNTYLNRLSEVYNPQPDNERPAWILVPPAGVRSDADLKILLSRMHITPYIRNINIPDAYARYFPDLIDALVDDKLITTPQEIKDIVTQAQSFYVDEPAIDLYQRGTFSPLLSIQSTAANVLDKQALPEEMEILLMVGTKRMNMENPVNEFIKSLYSVSCQNYLPFNSESPIQARIVLVKGVNQINQQLFRQILVICMKMEETVQDRLAVYAATLLSKSALTCFFFDHPDGDLYRILHAYQPKTEDKRKVCVYAFRGDNDENVKRKLGDQFLYFKPPLKAETLLNTQPLTPQECKALLAEANRFYVDEPAIALYKENVCSISYQINNDFSKLIEGFSPREKLVTLIAVGWKNKQISLFLNSFMLWNYSVSDLCCMIFNERIRIQAVCFNLCESDPNTQTSFSKLLMIYIRMKGKTGKLKNKVLSELVKALVSISVLHCFFLNSAKERHEAITDILRDREGEQNIPWVIVPPSTKEAISALERDYAATPIIVQPMSILEGAQAWKAQLLQLNAALLKLKPLSPTDLISTLTVAVEKANKVRNAQ